MSNNSDMSTLYKVDGITLETDHNTGVEYFNVLVYRPEWKESVEVRLELDEILDKCPNFHDSTYPLYIKTEQEEKLYDWKEQLDISEQEEIAEQVINAKYKAGDLNQPSRLHPIFRGIVESFTKTA